MTQLTISHYSTNQLINDSTLNPSTPQLLNLSTKKAPVETGAVKPKPTAYEKNCFSDTNLPDEVLNTC